MDCQTGLWNKNGEVKRRRTKKKGEKDKDNYTKTPSASSDSVTLHFAGGQQFSKSTLVSYSHGRMGEPITSGHLQAKV